MIVVTFRACDMLPPRHLVNYSFQTPSVYITRALVSGFVPQERGNFHDIAFIVEVCAFIYIIMPKLNRYSTLVSLNV